MKIEYHTDVKQFLQLCSSHLLEYETENNLLFGILNALRKNIHHYSKDFVPELISITENNELKLIAIRTPPFNQLISFTDDLKSISFLVDELLKKNTVLPGILGFNEGALFFSQLWAKKNKINYSLDMHERIYRLTEVNSQTLGNNTFDYAKMDDCELITEWMKGFILECFPDASEEEVADSVERVEKAIKRKKFYVLKADGKIVSMVKSAGITPNGQTINAVYTPPHYRKKGYATEVVAKISQKILNEGKKYCFLFTDLANPISNKIYQEIGFKPIIDMDQYKFYI